MQLAAHQSYKHKLDECYVFPGCYRGVEFLAVIGGLWNSCLFVGIVMWTFVMLVLRFDDHTYVYPT